MTYYNIQMVERSLSNKEIAKRLQSDNTDMLNRQVKEVIEGTKRIDNQILAIKNRLEEEKGRLDFKKLIENGGCLQCGGDIKNFLKMKPESSYDEDILKAYRLVISEDVENSKSFGSFIWAAQGYPGDIDVLETVTACCSKKAIVKKMKTTLIDIVKRILDRKGYYISEVKAGRDYRYMIEINDPMFIDKIKLLYDQHLFTDKEYESLITLYKHLDNDNKDVINEFLRNKYTLRWTPYEILNQVKILAGGIKKKLIDALGEKGYIKIDMIAPVDGRYIEFSNFFELYEEDKNGNKKIINLNKYPIFFDKLVDEIRQLSTKTFFNPFKMAKRMWGYARITKNEDILVKLSPLFNGNIARMNQIKTDLGTIMIMFERFKSLPTKFLLKELDTMKSRISYLYDIVLDEELIYGVLDHIVYYFDHYVTDKRLKAYGFDPKEKIDRKKVIGLLKNLSDYLKKIIYEYTLKYLSKNGLWPIPNGIFIGVHANNKYLFGTGSSGGYGTKKGAEKNAYIKHLKEFGKKKLYNKVGNIPLAPPLETLLEDLTPKHIKTMSNIIPPDIPPAPPLETLVEDLTPKHIKTISSLIPPNIYIYCSPNGPVAYDHPVSSISSVQQELEPTPKEMTPEQLAEWKRGRAERAQQQKNKPKESKKHADFEDVLNELKEKLSKKNK
jgi:hypothetical protein